MQWPERPAYDNNILINLYAHGKEDTKDGF